VFAVVGHGRDVAGRDRDDDDDEEE